jgi:Cu(I)/Ag(I) efflux system membrane fusion protein
MSAPKWTMGVVAAALLGIVGGYQWARRGARDARATPTQTAAPAAAPAEGERKVLYWHDPMKPDIRFDKPGKSPFMDMQLVPVYADETAAASVVVSASAQQSLGIRIGRVEKATASTGTSAVGIVGYDEHAIALVQARTSGYVAHLLVRAAMDRVRRGQSLAEVTVPAWIEAENEYLTLLNNDSGNSLLRDAVRQRLAVLGVPEAAILQVEKTRSVPTTTALRAPIDGVVTELGLRKGSTFETGAVLFRLNGTATVWVNAQVAEAQARSIAPGVLVEIRASGLPGEVFKGRVQAILPQIDPATRTVAVRIAVDNAVGKLSPGMFVQTTFAAGAGEPQLWVPSEAVIATGERNVVIRQATDQSFEVVHVTTGGEADGKTAILSGLAEGEAIVLSGQFLIDSEASLKSAVNRLSTPSSPAAGPAP